MRARSVNSAVRDSTAETGSWVVGRPAAATMAWRRVGDMPAVASATVGPRPVGDGCCGPGASSSRAVRTRRSRSSGPQTSACSWRVPSARGRASATAGSPSSPASSPSTSSYVVGSGATARVCATCCANRSSRSRARTTEARVPARVRQLREVGGDGVEQVGAGVQQPRQGVVLAGTERFGEGAGGVRGARGARRRRRGGRGVRRLVGAHPVHVSGPGVCCGALRGCGASGGVLGAGRWGLVAQFPALRGL